MSAITGSEAVALLGISRRMIRVEYTPAALSLGRRPQPRPTGVRRGTHGFRPAASAAHARPSSGGVLTRRHWPMVLGATPSTSAARRSDRPMWVSQASNWAGVMRPPRSSCRVTRVDQSLEGITIASCPHA